MAGDDVYDVISPDTFTDIRGDLLPKLSASHCWNMATRSVSPAPSYSSIMLTHGATARLIVILLLLLRYCLVLTISLSALATLCMYINSS